MPPMMPRIACLTLDVEADHHDLVPTAHFEALEHEPTWRWLEEFSRERALPWTAFVVGELLETRPRLAERLAATGWELALHSFSHQRGRPDTADEIRRGKAAFRVAFGYDPLGYRAPLGLITPEGLERLEAEGFRYDSSLFPAWRPGTFRNLDQPTEPFAVGPSARMIELPCAVIRGLRVIVSVSYMRLLGLPFYRLTLPLFGLPDVAVIDCHFHDLAPAPSAYRQLPPFWKFVYGRNRGRGREMLTWLVDWLDRQGYRFMTLGEAATLLAGDRERRSA